MIELPDLKALAGWDERLREVATDRPAVERALASGMTYVGHASLLLGRYAEAVRALRDAAALAPGTATTIRLAEALRCADELAEAERLLRDALAAGDEHEHYALQHLGKTLVDAGRAPEAVGLLERALELRRTAGEPELERSTELALERAHRAAAS